jgi:hypothetical protein
MTKKENSGVRDLTFSGWVREKLPDSKTGFVASDLDFILCNYKTKKIMLLEIKTHNKKLPIWQKLLFENISEALVNGLRKDYEYLGFHTITFENSNFINGLVKLDGVYIKESELIEFLSFKTGELNE